MPTPTPAVSYERRRPETLTLYKVVQENLSTLYGAVDDGELKIALPRFVRKELEDFLACGMLCWGFARLKCDDCAETRLVSFSCKGRGFCPSCVGRRMAATSAHLVEDVLPSSVPLRQWVLTFPYAWRSRLGYDAPLLSALSRLFVQTVLEFYARRGGGKRDQSGSVTAVQRTSSDLKLQPHLHSVFLDGVYREAGDDLGFHALAHLSTTEVADVLERTSRRIKKWLGRRALLQDGDDTEDADDKDGIAVLAASAVSGTTPPAGPEWRRGGALPFASRPMKFERPLCVALDGFTLHAATRAGGQDPEGREALLKYILRPAVAKDRITPGPDGLVRVSLKKPFSDGTVAVDMDPLSLLCRLAASVPAPRFHTTRYAGVLASASKLRSRIAPKPASSADTAPVDEADALQGEENAEDPAEDPPRRGSYRPFVELLKRTFGQDILACPSCGGTMKLLALVTDPKSVLRYLRGIGATTDAPERSPARGPPYWKSTVLRRGAGDREAAE